MSVSEIKIGEIPIPLINYINLIRDRKPPYYDIVEHLVKEMKLYYLKGEQSVFVYAINPRILQEELEQNILAIQNKIVESSLKPSLPEERKEVKDGRD